jgi:hypothetical protein
MIQQFLTLEYGNKKRLKKKLDDYFGIDNYEVVEVKFKTMQFNGYFWVLTIIAVWQPMADRGTQKTRGGWCFWLRLSSLNSILIARRAF